MTVYFLWALVWVAIALIVCPFVGAHFRRVEEQARLRSDVAGVAPAGPIERGKHRS